MKNGREHKKFTKTIFSGCRAIINLYYWLHEAQKYVPVNSHNVNISWKKLEKKNKTEAFVNDSKIQKHCWIPQTNRIVPLKRP